MDDAARAAGTALAETARDVHALLLRGLIRQHPSEPGGPVGFTVLNLVRELLGARRDGAAEINEGNDINEAVEALAF